MLDTPNQSKLPNIPPASEVYQRYDYISAKPACESSKDGENQDCVSTRFVADGIGSYNDSQVHSQAAAIIYDKIFGPTSTPIPKNILDCKIKAFNLQIQNYCKENNLKKLKTTIVFAIPYTENGLEKICMVSQGDSLIFGYTHNGKCEQLTLNSHPLFKNISDQEQPEMVQYAIAIQQIIRDNTVNNSKNSELAATTSNNEINQIANEDIHADFIESMIVSARDMLPITEQLDAMKLRLTKISQVEQTKEIQKEIKSITKSLKLAKVIDLFITTKDLKYLIQAYISSMNIVNNFQTITHRNSSEFKSLIIASDGLSDNISSKFMQNILKIPNLSNDDKNQMLADGAVRANIKPDNISSLLVAIKQK